MVDGGCSGAFRAMYNPLDAVGKRNMDQTRNLGLRRRLPVRCLQYLLVLVSILLAVGGASLRCI